MDEIIRAVSQDGFVKISAITGKGFVQRAREIHNTTPVATAALGRALCATSMLGEMLKEERATVTMRIHGGGPIGTVLTVADSSGNVRGYVQNPAVDLPKRSDGKLNVGGAVGKEGMLTVSRDLGLKEPYIGSTALVSGEIAEDVTAYFAESEQVGAACGLGVLIDTDYTVRCAGGYIVQLLPGAPEDVIAKLEANVRRVGAVTEYLEQNDLEHLIMAIMHDLMPKILKRLPVDYRCYCSRERVTDAIASIGIKDLSEIAAGSEDTVAGCQFCDVEYRFTPEDIQLLLKEALEKVEEKI